MAAAQGAAGGAFAAGDPSVPALERFASVMAEHHVHEPVLGVAYDGTGYGTDGAAWGGEIMLAGLRA